MRHINMLSRAIRATTWNAPALISALVTGWIEDGTLAMSENKRRREGAGHQRLCREILRDIPIVSHRHASFAWLPLPTGRRAEPITARLAAQGIAVSTGEPFAVTDAMPQAMRLALGGIVRQELRIALESIREAINAAHESGNEN